MSKDVDASDGETEDALIPKGKKLLDTEILIAIARQMNATKKERIATGAPRAAAVPLQTKRAVAK